MRQIEIANIPDGWLSAGIAIDALAEKRQLEAEAMAVGGLEIAGVIPPLGLEIGMIEMIAREIDSDSRAGPLGIAAARCAQRQKQQRARERAACYSS